MRVKTTSTGMASQEPMLSNTGPNRRGSPVPVILILIILGVGGYFGWKAISNRMAAKRAEEAEYQRRLAEQKKRRQYVDEPQTNVVTKVEVKEVKPEPPPEPPKKTEAEILREEEAQRKAVWAQIEEARKKSEAQPMGGFAGIRFGEPIESGAPVTWGTALEEEAGDSVSSRGVAFAVYGPKLKKPFMSLGTSPLVWVTPKTRRPYRIEFSRALAPTGDKHDPETTNLVAILQAKFKSEPFAPRPSVPGRAGCEFVFPMGVTTVIVGEYGSQLKFSIEREDIRKETKAETDALRQEKSVVTEDGAVLDSKRYPNMGIDRKKYRGVRLKDETPRAFCGIVFASTPPESARIVVPQKGPKGFFLDYGMAKCRPFRGFAYGRADIDPVRGGVYAVHLTSEGGTEGQDDKDYYESVKAALSEHYKVTPSEKKGEGAFPELTYQIGDLTVVFGPDPRGGFFLRAENQVLAAMAK